jgi:hypothetical protein
MGWAVSKPLWAGDAVVDHKEEVFRNWMVSEDAVRLRAYFISLETGGEDPEADWVRAEQEFFAESGRAMAVRRDLPSRWAK